MTKNLSEDEVNEIINFAVASSALVIIMKHSSEFMDGDDDEARLEGLDDAVNLIFNNIPDVIMPHADDLASETLWDFAEQEKMVRQFLDEIEGL